MITSNYVDSAGRRMMEKCNEVTRANSQRPWRWQNWGGERHKAQRRARIRIADDDGKRLSEMIDYSRKVHQPLPINSST